MPFIPLGDALSKRMSSNTPLKRQVEATQVVELAKGVFEEMFQELAIHINPLFLKNRTLTVSCTSSVVAQEIRLRQNEIVRQLNEKFGKQEVDRIRYLI